jgi:hypothetical protein
MGNKQACTVTVDQPVPWVQSGKELQGTKSTRGKVRGVKAVKEEGGWIFNAHDLLGGTLARLQEHG